MESAPTAPMPPAGPRLDANAPGPFFVDGRCIDCGTCWQWDPQHFAPAPFGGTAHVARQPQGEAETERALLALRACPVAAIGAPAALVRRTPAEGFPALLTPPPAPNTSCRGTSPWISTPTCA